ncbi:MAG: 4a-hydroxytetrahydrobiopterin dehydratase [Ottowia sp.]|nr:4a-hydroxytetrahydrobiopterin dehydratase [Ottowia sp.]
MARQPGWSVATEDGATAIEKTWRFADFRAAMAHAERVAALADRLNHHPTLTVGWGACTVRWTTHDAGGLTAQDFDAARQTDLLAPGPHALPGAEPAAGPAAA